MHAKRIYIIAGESSGDAHGAVLMREIARLVPDAQFYGAGGPQMQKIAGEQLLDWTQEAVVGLWDVIVKYPFFREKFYQMYREIRQLDPDAVIFVDYPGFNLRLAHYLRRQGFTRKLIYYISPQVWAWNRGRIPRMATFLDLMICIFPFEKTLYEASGLRTEFAGHQMGAEAARGDLPIGVQNSCELMQRASVGMVASGTATLESSFYLLPFVLIYKVSWLTYVPGRLLIRVDHLGMPNILAGREIIPEFIQHQALPVRIADSVWKLYSDSQRREAMVTEMSRVIQLLDGKGAGRRAAEACVRELAANENDEP
jgi:lipid A disaccharide synthetase